MLVMCLGLAAGLRSWTGIALHLSDDSTAEFWYLDGGMRD